MSQAALPEAVISVSEGPATPVDVLAEDHVAVSESLTTTDKPAARDKPRSRKEARRWSTG
ncbi:hypothetical protein [Streptomyces chrestomyceticus]|uniref:hypothetical protein n=1 Tax=Streptomyces chrestomyceticus TaxID=68185 RepID=UPI00378D6F1D